LLNVESESTTMPRMDGYLRIGELSERVGVSPDVLRAWERRYGLVEPDRSDGGFRLYSDDDVARIRHMVDLIDQGLSAAEAARLARQEVVSGVVDVRPGEGESPLYEAGVARLIQALDSFDEPAVHAVLDELLASLSLESVLREAVMPLLQEIGRRWESGELSVGQEHFASNLVRGRLLAIARGWGLGSGRRVLLAAPSGEEHDLGLVAFGIAMWRRGWRVTFLGADTPPHAIEAAVRAVRPELLVLASVRPEPLAAMEDTILLLREEVTIALGGRGASAELADRLSVHHLANDPVTEADQIARVLPG
jgi:MerR family transcriptional regulator, light-induced transcriptional regulator